MVRINVKGNFKNTDNFFKKLLEKRFVHKLEKYGKAGVDALASATPKRSGQTAASWSYEIVSGSGYYSIYWNNSNIHNHVNVALILQYGHGTGTGGYVQGIDYINPAIRPIFEQIAEEAWMEVTNT